MKRRVRAVILPLLFLLVTGYFVYNAVNFSRGIRAQRQNAATLAQDRADLATVSSRRDRWQARVGALRHHAIARDMLDQQARSVLDLADPDDLSLPLKVPPPPTAPVSPPARPHS